MKDSLVKFDDRTSSSLSRLDGESNRAECLGSFVCCGSAEMGQLKALGNLQFGLPVNPLRSTPASNPSSAARLRLPAGGRLLGITSSASFLQREALEGEEVVHLEGFAQDEGLAVGDPDQLAEVAAVSCHALFDSK